MFKETDIKCPIVFPRILILSQLGCPNWIILRVVRGDLYFQTLGRSAPEGGSSSDSLTSLHSRLIQVKRDFRDIKMATEKQLDDVKSEMYFVHIC